MRSKVVWSIVSILMVAMLLAVSCGPKTATTPTPAPALTPTPAAAPTPAPAPAPTPAPAQPTTTTETPKYGGTLNLVNLVDLEVFDSSIQPRMTSGGHAGLVWEQLSRADWTKGITGSGQFDWGTGVVPIEGYGPGLAESWETPEIGVWVFKIRKGVHWALNPASEASRLVNGREFTADDVVFSINYLTKSAKSAVSLNRPVAAATTQVEKTGPWEVTLKIPQDPIGGWHWIAQGGGSQYYFAHEVIEKYGNMQNWRNMVGTGPFMLSDFVPGSVATFIRNPGYWDKESLGPGKGMQLPYLDAVKLLIVPDLSTRMAVLRTSKADWDTDIPYEDAQSLMRTAPKILNYGYIPASSVGIFMRTDKKDLPYKDKRVRQALMMATDFEALKKDLYGGRGEIQVWPVSPIYKEAYVPIDQLPESTRALYKYNPERAKQLLAEAGYPAGFKARIIVRNISNWVDPISVYKAMWAKVGVDLDIQLRETAVWSGIQATRSHEEMLMSSVGTTSFPIVFGNYSFRGSQFENASYINDPPGSEARLEGVYQEILKNAFVNMPKTNQLLKEELPYILEQAYVIPLPSPFSYRFWQPWVKNYHGEVTQSLWVPHVWIDQDLREAVTGKR